MQQVTISEHDLRHLVSPAFQEPNIAIRPGSYSEREAANRRDGVFRESAGSGQAGDLGSIWFGSLMRVDGIARDRLEWEWMAEPGNRATVEQFWQTANARDWDALEKMLDSEYAWEMPLRRAS